MPKENKLKNSLLLAVKFERNEDGNLVMHDLTRKWLTYTLEEFNEMLTAFEGMDATISIQGTATWETLNAMYFKEDENGD